MAFCGYPCNSVYDIEGEDAEDEDAEDEDASAVRPVLVVTNPSSFGVVIEDGDDSAMPFG